jgi:shikimate kinase
MKSFVFGVQCSGKSTVAKYLRATTKLRIVEMDEEILKLNHGTWPRDLQYKVNELEPQVYRQIKGMSDVVFFDSHISIERMEDLKKRGFSLILLEVERAELLRRNKQRMVEEGYDDASVWIDKELDNVKELRSRHLIDHVVNAEEAEEIVAGQLLAKL